MTTSFMPSASFSTRLDRRSPPYWRSKTSQSSREPYPSMGDTSARTGRSVSAAD